jgi:hypothetical protein
MRELLDSEKRCIERMMQYKWNMLPPTYPIVYKEHYVRERQAPSASAVNDDFSIYFADRRSLPRDQEGMAVSALPNLVGAELYLYVEAKTHVPLVFELMGASRLPRSLLQPSLDHVVATLRASEARDVGDCIAFSKLRFSRILHVLDDIVFTFCFDSATLNFPLEQRQQVTSSTSGETTLLLRDGSVVGVDGWLHSPTVG